jgi:hypothetical protein
VETLENEDFAGQLRLLRLLLGRNFKPISTEALAGLSRIPVVSVRGIEAGRRVLNERDRRMIALYMGARWDDDTRQWVRADFLKAAVPFDRTAHEEYLAKIDSGRELVPKNHEEFEKALEFLLSRLSAKEANFLLLNLHQSLLTIAHEHSFEGDAIETLERHVPIVGAPQQRFIRRMYDNDGNQVAVDFHSATPPKKLEEDEA